jgi:hypothetical protein
MKMPVTVLLSLSLFSQASLAQEPSPRRKNNEKALKELSGFVSQAWAYASGTEVACGSPCVIKVELRATTDTDSPPNIYCASLTKNYKFTSSTTGNPSKKIVWELDKTQIPTTFPDGVFEFHETHGVLLIENPGRQIVPRASGEESTPDNAEKFVAFNRHQKPGSAIYFPVVAFYRKVGGVVDRNNPELCAAADPKVVNY